MQCVVLDLTAPFALDFLDQMAEKAELRAVPVVADARGGGDRPDAGDLQRLRGATNYVTKPVDPEELLSCIERWLAVLR